MSDRDLETLLRRYRPVGPPPALRERILRPGRSRGPWWWLGAAAALFAVVVGTQIVIGWEMSTLSATLATDADADAREALLDLLGDDESARQLTTLRLAEQEARRALEPPLTVGGLGGGRE
jgi:hypothetical protein